MHLEVDELQLGISSETNNAVQAGDEIVTEGQALELRARI